MIFVFRTSQFIVSEPILEFKGSVQHIQKGHPTLVTQVDLILHNRWKLRALVTIGLNSLSSLHTLLRYFVLFKVSYFLSEIFKIPDSGSKRNLEIFTLFIFKKLTERPPLNCKINREDFFKGLPTIVRQWRKFWFLEPLKCLFQHSENTCFWKRLI